MSFVETMEVSRVEVEADRRKDFTSELQLHLSHARDSTNVYAFIAGTACILT